MNRTNANDFRTDLKHWMDSAVNEPVQITRKSGEAFVLMTSEAFQQMQLELANLRGIAAGLSDVVHGRTRSSEKDGVSKALSKAKERVLGKKIKQAAG